MNFLWGVLAGSVAELLIILASRWLWDRSAVAALASLINESANTT